MNLLSFIKIIIKYKFLLIITCLIALAISWYVAYFQLQDEYKASTIIIISNQKNKDNQEDLSYTEYALNVTLVNTYRVLCKTDNILNKVLDKLDEDISVNELKAKIQVESEGNTEIFKISARDRDPKLAAQIADYTAQVFEKEIPVIMKIDNVQIIDRAPVPTAPVSPNRNAIMFLSLIGGIMLCAAIIFLLEHLDITVKTEQQLEEILQVPVISSIPHVKTSNPETDKKRGKASAR